MPSASPRATCRRPATRTCNNERPALSLHTERPRPRKVSRPFFQSPRPARVFPRGNGGCPGDCTNFHAYADNLNLTTDTASRAFDFQAAGATGAVPEPATWAMMLIGFGAIGVSFRPANVPDKGTSQATTPPPHQRSRNSSTSISRPKNTTTTIGKASGSGSMKSMPTRRRRRARTEPRRAMDLRGCYRPIFR